MTATGGTVQYIALLQIVSAFLFLPCSAASARERQKSGRAVKSAQPELGAGKGNYGDSFD